MNSRNAVAFLVLKNKYSIAVLTGVIEERFTNLDIYFLEEGGFNHQIISLAHKYEKVVVGFSFHTPDVIKVSQIVERVREQVIRKQIDNMLLVAGGPHPSGDPVGTLELGIDVVVVGEGEVAFPALLERFFSNRDYEDVKRLAFFDQDRRYRFTGRAPAIELGEFPAFAPKHRRFSPIEISRGCPWACKFCQTPFLMGGRMRHRPINSIVHYAQIAKTHGLRDLRFITPASFAYGSLDGRSVNPRVLEQMLQSVAEIFGKDHVYLGSFPSEVRPENVTRETLSLIKKYCANNNIIIGAQTGSLSLLKFIHRGHGIQEVIRAVQLSVEAGIIPNVDFIFGLPGETKEDVKETLDLMVYLIKLGARIHSHTFMPLVGTPFSEAPPGRVSPSIRQMLEKLRGKGLEYGDWKKQERIAQETWEFLRRQRQRRPEYLRKVNPFKPQ